MIDLQSKYPEARELPQFASGQGNEVWREIAGTSHDEDPCGRFTYCADKLIAEDRFRERTISRSGPRGIDMPRVRAAVVASLARPFATAARSPAALPRIATVPRYIVPRIVSIEHSFPLIVDTTREGPTAVSGGWWKSSSDLRMYADGAGS